MLQIILSLLESRFSLSSELGAVGAIEAKVGRGRSDGARFPAVAVVEAAVKRPRQHRDGSQARANLHRASCQR